MRMQWLSIFGKENSAIQDSSNLRLCDQHFSKTDFIRDPRTNKKLLKRDSVPM